MNSPGGTPLLEIQSVEKHYPVAGALPWGRPTQFVRAVDGVSLKVWPRETLSIVGESGCGKSTTAKLVLSLEAPTKGRIFFRGIDLREMKQEEQLDFRRGVQAVFQNPFSSLNPRMRIEEIVGEPSIVHASNNRKQLRQEVERLLAAVGLGAGLGRAFPHQLSGGMRQRVALARALILRPMLIVLDEPVSALDVSIRAQIINLLKDLQEQFGLAYLLIAHDLGTTRYLSHRTAVMYLGQIVEFGQSDRIFSAPLHPYTQALISAARPAPRWHQQEEVILKGEIPSPITPPSGCRFHTRCPVAFDACVVKVPQLREVQPNHWTACHLYESAGARSSS